ncbi:MAG: hypothetical protein VX523_00405 [Chloroflexota bacterium]|nr:hypothetical protein [Chloroflexota bacterium]
MPKHSLEIVPKQIDRLKLLPDNSFKDVYVAFIPGDNYLNIIEASKSLIKFGYNPIPHCPARTLKSEEQLEDFLMRLNAENVKDILVIGGSPKKQQGPFSKSMDLFSTGLFKKFQFNEVHIAGHPEGNPDDSNSDMNLFEKCNWLFENNLEFSIVTQWTLDVEKTNQWIINTKNHIEKVINKKIPIKIGIAGPAKLTTLINYAKICGVSATTLIVKNKKFGLTKLFKHNPNEIIEGLENYDQLHFFPFGGIKELTRWLEEKEGKNVKI